MLTNKEIALNAAKTLNDKKGIDVIVLDISDLSAYADFLVIASGNNERHIDSLVDDVEEKLAKEGIIPKNIEGRAISGWILMDYGDIIVNVLTKEQRLYYNIELLWSDGRLVSV